MDKDRIHNLGIGVFGLSSALASLLDSIGVNYRELRVDEASSIFLFRIYCASTSKSP